MKSPVRIGTRDSELALWQAQTVQRELETLGLDSVLVPIKSKGDIVLDKPLYELGITGIFTKALDIALINGDIDLAVHSMKDVPTALPKGVVTAAVLERGETADVLLHKGTQFLDNSDGIIATGSLRRKAQWLHRYPQHQVVDLRGNVNTRLLKLIENGWNGAIFAKAGLQRIRMLPQDAMELDWMVPAPAQGALLLVALKTNTALLESTSALNHETSAQEVQVEREFLRTLEGGCTAPIGALAKVENQKMYFKGCLHALDGQQEITVEKEQPIDRLEDFGKACAQEILESGGHQLMQQIKNGISSLH